VVARATLRAVLAARSIDVGTLRIPCATDLPAWSRG
jgi:hypothetical protein